ncbi:transposase family protein, partial [Streptomyces sp. NPDC051014]|uniref:transposase family protein n=1 Tax=Streptomyces sp. NPDC051014 TaxID=3155751 RepID=UPI0033C665D0
VPELLRIRRLPSHQDTLPRICKIHCQCVHTAEVTSHLKISALADKAYQGAGGIFATPVKKRRDRELTIKEKSVNRAHAPLRSPVERAFIRLKAWRIFRRARVSPNTLTSMAKAILTLERQRRRSSVLVGPSPKSY